MKRFLLAWLGGAPVALVWGSIAFGSVTVIDTQSDLSNVYNVNSLGEGTTPTYGQTFTAPDDNILNSFRFKLGHGGDIPTTVRFFVMGWEGDKVAGPVLYQSDPVTLIQSQFYQDYNLLTGGISLVPGNQYVMFFTSFLDFDGIHDESSALARHYSTDPYEAGRFVLNNGATSLAGLAAGGWQTDFLGAGDLAFRAQFTSAPPGDYNGDHKVDAADYVTWRTTGLHSETDVTDYNVWRSHFGEVLSDGASVSANGRILGSDVPKPASKFFAVASGLVGAAIRCRRTR